MEHPIFTSELFVNPLASSGGHSVTEIQRIQLAKFPFLDASWDVKSLTDVSTVDIVEKRVSPSARADAMGV